MTERVRWLRERSLKAVLALTAERALIMTKFYRENLGKYLPPILRALPLCPQGDIHRGG